MNLYEYIYEKLGIIIVNLFSMFALSIFLKLLGLSFDPVLIILICWLVILVATLSVEYLRLKGKYAYINRQLDTLDQKYLICELLGKPSTQIEKIYYEMLRSANKSMIEEVGRAREVQHSYKEYIEEWIHEIKTPITAIDLICKNHKSEVTDRIKKELSTIDYLVEQALYYARSEIVEKDYFVKKIPLFDVVQKSILNVRTAILENHIQLLVDETDDIVFTDEKWLNFIIIQILTNSIKYCKKENAQIHIYAEKLKNGVTLAIEDNGIGISPAELPRIFEKGFTGSNRANSKSTGIGLYLCKKLADKLGLTIKAESEKGKFTKITLFFPTDNFINDFADHKEADLQNCK